jgi:sec-independent protein translocase protein TatC
MSPIADADRTGSEEEKDRKDTGRVKEEDEMPFLEHLEELRWRIIKTLAGIVIGGILCWVYIDQIVDYVLLHPVRVVNEAAITEEARINLQNLKPFGLLFLYMEVAFVGGIIISLPNILYQFWAFIAPGLFPRERRHIRWIVFFTSFCFLAGVAFAYYIMLPSALTFFAGLSTGGIRNNIAINEYMSFIMSVMLGAGAVFELPMASWFLSRLGLLTPAFMRHYRRHAIVAILILSAALTPGTDPVSQILLAIPLVVLYEISIGISAIAQRKRDNGAQEPAED